jgi:hypothetical protein
MALLTSEIQRIKYELGYPLLGSNADPYIGTVAVFDTVIQEWMQAGETTTSATTVVASAISAPVSLTLADATGFVAQTRISVDVGVRQESTFVQSVSGLVIACSLAKAHSGTYPVTVDGGESIVREILGRIVEANAPRSSLLTVVSSGEAQIKKVDDIEFFETKSSMSSSSRELDRQIAMWRDELAYALGVPNLRSEGCSSSLSVY